MTLEQLGLGSDPPNGLGQERGATKNMFFYAPKYDFNLIHNLNARPTLCHVFVTGLSSFLSRNNLFCLSLSSNYFKMNFT